jgi:hypothetical protein
LIKAEHDLIKLALPLILTLKEINPLNVLIFRGFGVEVVPGAGLEPAQPQWSQDFKSCVSTIPPSGLKNVMQSSSPAGHAILLKE